MKWEYVETKNMQENYYIYRTGQVVVGEPYKEDVYRKLKRNGTYKYKTVRRK